MFGDDMFGSDVIGDGATRRIGDGRAHKAPSTRCATNTTRPQAQGFGSAVESYHYDDWHAMTNDGPKITAPHGVYDLVLALFCSFLLISNVGATKLIAIGPDWHPGGISLLPLVFDGGAILFPLTYIFGDVLAEVYGFARARRAIIIGFAVALAASLIFWVVDIAPPAPGWENDAAWHAVLGFVPRIVIASLAGYLVGQFLNAWVLVRIKARLGTGRLWVRLLGSTIVGEFADTIVFCTVAWAGAVPLATLVNYTAVGYVYKVAVEAILLPVTYRVIAVIKRHEAQD